MNRVFTPSIVPSENRTNSSIIQLAIIVVPSP